MISSQAVMQRLAALVPRPRLQLIRFHGVLAPNAKLRAMVVPQGPEEADGKSELTATEPGCAPRQRPVRRSAAVRNLPQPGRSVAMGARGAAATSHPLSTSVAIETLRHGGNAVDAAVTACILRSVLELDNAGLGGDCFALVWKAAERLIFALNGASHARQGLSDDWLLAQGICVIGTEDVHAVMVPGAVNAWQRLFADHGTVSLSSAFEPTINCAERAAADWATETGKLGRDAGARAHFLLSDGSAPPIRISCTTVAAILLDCAQRMLSWRMRSSARELTGIIVAP